MNQKIKLMIWCVCVVLFNNFVMSDDAYQSHVICSHTHKASSNNQLNEWNEQVHTATYTIKQYFKNNYTTAARNNNFYPRHADSVFFINFNYIHGSWTLYKPSYISYEDFVVQAKKIYAQHNLDVTFEKEASIKILALQTGFDGEYLTLQEFETYKKQSDSDLDDQIQELQKKALTESQVAADIAQLKKIKNMNDFFFWHLQIPTTGLLPSKEYSLIAEKYRPIAWNFLLWDLAPKKGKGAQVALIDTGVSAFNIKELAYSKEYKKNINIYTPCNLQSYGYNLVSENGLDPIRQIAINFGHYCDHKKFDMNELMKNLPKWIKLFIEKSDKFQIEQYFIKNAKKSYIDESGTKLNQQGCNALEDLLHGKYGITPKNSQPFFNVINLEKPYSQNTLLETLPAPKIIGNKDTFAAGHGTFTQGIVCGQSDNSQGIIGLAPHAHVTMIKAFHDTGTTNKTTLNAALERAITLKSSIVSMSLKITDSISDSQDATLKKLIDSIDYVVAASGNDGDDPQLFNKEAYPAKFESVAFDVGAFKYDDGNYSICSFTQKELNIGPKFLAPGYDIFSSTLTPDQTADSMYAFMSGTSVAVPIVTGFLALALAEFQDVFTREEILKVVYKFSIKLNKNWEKETILGTIDMRSSLLCLHALKALKIKLSKKSYSYSFAQNFDNLIQAIYTINYYAPLCYEKKLGYSLTNDFAHYQKAVESKDILFDDENKFIFTIQKNKSSYTNLIAAINFITNAIISAINKNDISKIDKKNDMNDAQNLLQSILTNPSIHLFDHVPLEFQARINSVLTPRQNNFKMKLQTHMKHN